MRCSSLSGSKNSTNSRGKSSATSRLRGSSSLALPLLRPDVAFVPIRSAYDSLGLPDPGAVPADTVTGMRLGVLDVGSNTVHLLIVDAHLGAHPWPAHSEKNVLRLAERIGGGGKLSESGATALVDAVAAARKAAIDLQVDDLLAFATSAVRDATNSADVLCPGTHRDRRGTAGALRRGRGPDDVPGRTPLVRLECRPGARARHRRRFAGTRRRHRRRAGRRVVAAARRRAAVPDEAAPATRPRRREIDALTEYVETTLDTALAAGRPGQLGQGGGDLEDVPDAGAAGRCGTVE